jgi:hypothetical protein
MVKMVVLEHVFEYISGIDDDVDFSGWELPPLEDDPDREPPLERPPYSGVSIGSDLAGLRLAGGGVLDLGKYVCNDLASVRPTVVGLSELGSTDFGSLTQTQRVDALLVIEQHRAWLDGLQQQVLAAVSLGDTSKDRWVKEEVSAALGLAPVTAGTKLKNAEQLCSRLPSTLGLLLDGRISELQARAVTEASYVLPDAVLPGFEERVLKRAPEQTLRQLRDVVKRAQIRLDPASAERRTQRARGDRSVRVADAGDGMAWLTALLPAEQAAACMQRVDAAARMAPTEDARTLEHRRADVLVDAVLGGLAGDLPTRHGLQPNISVIVGLETLAGVEDEPGWLEGYGPVTAQTARALAADEAGTWRRLVIDPIFGQVIDYGTTSYRPPTHLAELVIARDGTCTFPPCNRPARSCDLDHEVPFPDGDTSAENLGSKCRRDHRLKHQAGWQARRNRDGTSTWTSPQGREYTNHPPTRWKSPANNSPCAQAANDHLLDGVRYRRRDLPPAARNRRV